jgi:Putative adhesin
MIRRALVLLLGFGMALAARGAETERTLRAELSGADLADFQVEGLAGIMRISVGAVDRLTVVATVRAENADLADGVRLERVLNGGAAATLRVRYPASVTTVRYVEPGRERDWPFGDVGSSESYDYDGRRMRVNPGRGDRLSVDLAIQVPAGRRKASFRNLVGRIEADGIEGTLRFEVGSADLRLRRLDGEISVAGDSGDIQASDLKGGFDFDSSSGDCRLDDFDGGQFRFHASSGDLVARDVRAQRFETETSSGDVTVSSADIEEFRADSSSGDVAVDVAGKRLASFVATTSSGDVSLGLPADGSFDAAADQSSGDMVVGFAEGTAMHDDEALVGFRRGTGGARIRVTTSSGDFSISPR